MALEVRHIKLLSDLDSEGALLFRDQNLVAVLSQLGASHEKKVIGLWSGFQLEQSTGRGTPISTRRVMQ
jgi:hypothetical protein